MKLSYVINDNSITFFHQLCANTDQQTLNENPGTFWYHLKQLSDCCQSIW